MSPSQQRRVSDADGMTLPEVARLIEALRNDTTTRFDRLDQKIDSFDTTYVRREIYVAVVGALEARLAKVEGALQWVLRTVGGAVMVAVVGAFFAASKWI